MVLRQIRSWQIMGMQTQIQTVLHQTTRPMVERILRRTIHHHGRPRPPICNKTRTQHQNMGRQVPIPSRNQRIIRLHTNHTIHHHIQLHDRRTLRITFRRTHSNRNNRSHTQKIPANRSHHQQPTLSICNTMTTYSLQDYT